ncbi:MAG TPA: Ig-like domain-containing protein [Verrucomicrobiae bacterium]
MKTIPKTIMAGALVLALTTNIFAQSPPYLAISQDSTTTVQINWTNQVGTTYRVLSTSDLTTPLSLWTPLEDAFSEDVTVSVGASIAVTPIDFFNVEIPTNSGVQIFSPTNEETVSGVITVGVGAQIGTQIQGVNLYLDDALIGFIDSGGIAFSLDTTHFTNGLHTLYVSANDSGNGTTTSDPITLDFENPVRWLDADSLFQSFVPIDVESDIFPADWAVFVADTNGTIVRTFSGSTSDGNINTNWDGNDNDGATLPDESAYTITVVVTSSGSGDSMMMTASSLASTSGATSVSSTTNPHGVPEYTVQKPAPNPLTAYLEILAIYNQLTPQEKLIYPPLPPVPANNPYATTLVKMSAQDMFLAQHQTANTGTTPMDAGSGGGSSGSTSTTVWREAAWNSGEIVLTRQNLNGTAGLVYNGVVANLFDNIRTLVTSAQGDIGGDRETYEGSVLLMQHNGDFGQVKDALASSSPNTREFYFWGHGAIDGNAIGYREGTPNDGIKVSDLKPLLGNYYLPQVGNSSQKIITHKPFDFVFLDGCMTGVGSFPEAFGIPKAVASSTYDDNHKHKRAFMGWNGTISLSILDTESLNWSLAFWNTWLGNPNSGVEAAVIQAFNQHPSAGDGATIALYGSKLLKWND